MSVLRGFSLVKAHVITHTHTQKKLCKRNFHHVFMHLAENRVEVLVT